MKVLVLCLCLLVFQAGAYAEEEWRQALADARALQEREPESLEALSALGEALFRAGLFEELDTKLSSMEDEPEAPARGLTTLARLRGAQGRQAEAVALMGRAVAAAPEEALVWFWAADFSSGREESIARLERYLELSEGEDPDRIEAANGSIRMYRALGDRAIWVPTMRPERVELPLAYLKAMNGRYLGHAVKVSLGKGRKPLRLLLDSGSGGLFVAHRAARKRSFEPLAAETFFGGGGDKRHLSQRGIFPRCSIDGLVYSDVLATSSNFGQAPGGQYQGLIGLTPFEGYRITLDLEKGRLILDSGEPLTEGSDYWTVSGQILVRVRANEEHSGLFLFDTGANASIIAESLVAEVGRAEEGRATEVRGFGGRVDGARLIDGVEVTFQDLKSGGRSLTAVDFSLRSRLGGVEISGYLGMDLLQDSVIEIDTRTRKIRVSSPVGRAAGRAL